MRPVSNLFAHLTIATALAFSVTPQLAHADVGPENVLLVVNRASWASRTVANHYIDLRKIPANNVVYLDWTGGTDNVDVEVFRRQILGPILMQVERRGLSDQIDAIIYSSDFPYQVNLAADLGKEQPPQQLSPYASITSATYLWQLVMTKNPNVIGLRNNQYTRSAKDRDTDPATQGFRSWYGWGANGELLEGGGIHYMLSTMLAVTSGRGNSVDEAVGYLRRSAKADGTRPPGTIYFCVNGDVRAKTRADGFAAAIDDLEKAGVRGEVVNSTLPSGKKDVAGVMAGVADFSWSAAQSTILPGAICEHLTSFGGAMAPGNGQTPLSEFLRYGAAGASGSVVEPYAIQDKFPLPSVQVHYARGSTLVEAFYQSVFGPYQLLIVGDPLCRTWANIPTVNIEGMKAGEKLSGKVDIRATAKVSNGAVDRMQMFVDGRRVLRRPAGSALPLDTTELSDGYHELRVVAIDGGPIETQGRKILPFEVDNGKKEVVKVSVPGKVAQWDKPFAFTIEAPGMQGGIVLVNGMRVEEFKGEEAKIDFPARNFGSGPATAIILAATSDKPPRLISSTPISLELQPSPPLPALKEPKADQLKKGLRLRTASGQTASIDGALTAETLRTAGAKPTEAFALESFFESPAPAKNSVAIVAPQVANEGMFQFQIRYTGDLKIAVDNMLLHDGKEGKFQQYFLPVALAPGMHRLRVSGKSAADMKLEIRYGGLGTRPLDGETFRQLAK